MFCMQMCKYDPPEFTLSAFDEIGRDESTIPVFKQRSYTGVKVIPSALADTPCADLGVREVFDKLNTILGTSRILSPKISSVLRSYIKKECDFGTVYAHLRLFWFHPDASEKMWQRYEENDREMRRNAIVGDKITKRGMPPRRLWDLCANRVMPYWIAPRVFTDWYAISHAWVSDDERTNVMSPINGYEWPVPMPKDADLNLIRIEMLNFRAKIEYAWLDVLCLRQKYAIREDHHKEEDVRKEALRLEEWKLDVPTIGGVYIHQEPEVVCYLSGLGLPLNFKLGDFDSGRCWFNRAWTLQEIPPAYDPLIEEIRTRVHERLHFLLRVRSNRAIFDILSEMQHRMASSPLDKVAGLIHILRAKFIPIYDENQSPEELWTAIVDVLSPSLRAALFIYFPGPGNGNRYWRPSWEQVMVHTVPWHGYWSRIGDVNRMEKMDFDWHHGLRVGSIYVYGLANPLERPRQGKLFFEDYKGESCVCKIVADHTYPIPDDRYVMISAACWYRWVVGRLRNDGKFEKVALITLALNKEAEEHWHRTLRAEKFVATVLC
ncbi:uncharacterized protein EV420DRAFT_1572252 [Desarmillaria tabescens]|uniref:Heterokaryon incompatibility domain-containing protein n=1 Tax=Armillaria tabescens TaxID=1929756 RepID=A0AA39MSS4_ARMTA|nr:uncharacterized protein EV420DRAFT_1572252 [Desarmillaria tabescens]KAK0445292.1 hypothetical protein EV420DRAFT_1572252 [Desarmillaria tabescens]